MLVYGDAERVARADEGAQSLLRGLEAAVQMPAGLDRHAALVGVFIGLGEIVQGLADAAFERLGEDAGSAEETAGMGVLVALARAIRRSWRSGFAEAGPLPLDALRAFSKSLRHETTCTKRPEGYAFYALYPESYLEAAWRSGLGPHTRVIGLRSIGTGLAALVAAALDAPPPITLRPTGHPFRREVRLSDALARDLLHDKEADFAIVDEGPGLSGSSFGAVADWLEANGVERRRIHGFPSHRGDLGPQASAPHRDRWAVMPRHVVEADHWLLRGDDPAHRLQSWIAAVTGPLDGPLQDISGGAWRALRYEVETSWPPANIQQERRKFLARAGGRPYLAKFVGLGEAGRDAFARAQALYEAGFTPQPLALCHGFLVEHWIEEVASLHKAMPERAAILDRLGAYLGCRARAFPTGQGSGAALGELARMAVHNGGEALGAEAGNRLRRHLAGIEAEEIGLRRVATDNRLQAHEWIVTGGRLLKTDAVDHAAAHDLVGCQDIAWDVAGAIVEFGLSPAETRRVIATVEGEGGASVLPALVRRLVPCYLAFQLGAVTMAAEALAGSAEEERLRLASARYAGRLAEWLDAADRGEPCPSVQAGS